MWYSQQASRAVNQAIGRVIRHKHDYGLIILADIRYSQPQTRNERSVWLRDRQFTFHSFDDTLDKVTNFFADMKSRNFPVKQCKKQIYTDISGDESESENSMTYQTKYLSDIYKGKQRNKGKTDITSYFSGANHKRAVNKSNHQALRPKAVINATSKTQFERPTKNDKS